MPKNEPIEPRREPTQARAVATVDAVLEATAQLLVELGYAKTSTNKIAKRAGVSVGSLYQYFPNKDAIILELLTRFADRQHMLLAQRLETVDSSDTRAFIRATIEALVQGKREDLRLSGILFEQIPRSGKFDLVDIWMNRSVALIQGVLEANQAQLPVDNPKLTAYVIVHAFSGVVNHATLRRPDLFEDDKLIDEVTELFGRYLERKGSVLS